MHRQRIARRSVFSLALALGLTAACGACGKKGDEIVVGAFLSLTGKDSSFGIDTKNGIDLAVEQVNASGGIKGKKVKVVYEDDKSTQAEATLKVQQLIDRDGAVAILGEVASNRSLAGGLVANNKKVPMVTPSSTAVEVTKGREWVFRTCFTDAQQGEVAGRFVRENLKKATASVFYVAQDAYSSGLANSFKETFEKLGGKVILSKGFQDGETNFTTYLNELKSGNPEVIFAPVYYNSMAVIARQAKQVGIEGKMFVGGDGWDSSELIEGAGAELEGAYFTNHYAPDVPWENSKQFISSYKAKYTREPNSLAAQGYDAARLLFDAIGRAPEPKPEAIRAALVDTKDFKGATGTMTIDKDRNANKPIVVVQIKDKKFTYSTELKSGS